MGAPSELRAPCCPRGLHPEKPALPEGGTQLGYEGQARNSHPSSKAPDMQGCRGSVGCIADHRYLGSAFPALGCACGRGGQSLALKPRDTASKRHDLRQRPSFLTFLLCQTWKKTLPHSVVNLSGDYVKCRARYWHRQCQRRVRAEE